MRVVARSHDESKHPRASADEPKSDRTLGSAKPESHAESCAASESELESERLTDTTGVSDGIGAATSSCRTAGLPRRADTEGQV